MKNKHYDIIRPTEEETVSTNVLKLYDQLCQLTTLPWAIFQCGQSLAEWYTGNSKDNVLFDYIIRIVYDMSCKLSENSDYNIDLK